MIIRMESTLQAADPAVTWRRFKMKGYNTDSGYMGCVDGKYILFCSEGDFLDFIREMQDTQADFLEEAA